MLSRHSLLTAMVASALLFPSFVSAQTGSEGAAPNGDHTAREEAEGRTIWEKIQRKDVQCVDLSDEQFASLGEFFMGGMMGDAHEAMNARLERMMGKEGEEQMHVVMGKRMSGCEPNAPMPGAFNRGGMMPLMMTMMGGWQAPTGFDPSDGFTYASSMMGYGFAPFGFLFMILWLVLIIVGIVALVRWLSRTSGTQGGKSPLDILKERYARGEIDKKEFEERRKDLT